MVKRLEMISAKLFGSTLAKMTTKRILNIVGNYIGV